MESIRPSAIPLSFPARNGKMAAPSWTHSIPIGRTPMRNFIKVKPSPFLAPCSRFLLWIRISKDIIRKPLITAARRIGAASCISAQPPFRFRKRYIRYHPLWFLGHCHPVAVPCYLGIFPGKPRKKDNIAIFLAPAHLSPAALSLLSRPLFFSTKKRRLLTSLFLRFVSLIR